MTPNGLWVGEKICLVNFRGNESISFSLIPFAGFWGTFFSLQLGIWDEHRCHLPVTLFSAGDVNQRKRPKKIVPEISCEDFLSKLALVKKLFSKIKLFTKIFSILLKSGHPGLFFCGFFFLVSCLPMHRVDVCVVPRAIKPHAPTKLLCSCSSWSVLEFPTYSSNSV